MHKALVSKKVQKRSKRVSDRGEGLGDEGV